MVASYRAKLGKQSQQIHNDEVQQGLKEEKGHKGQQAKELVRMCWNWGLGEAIAGDKFEGMD